MKSLLLAASDPVRLLAQADLLLLLKDVLITPIRQSAQWPALGEIEQIRQLFNHAGLDASEPHADLLVQLWQESIADHGALLALVHGQLFEGAMLCPVNETAYIRRDKGAILADLAGFYQAFGFDGGRLPEKLDHITVELEFVAILLIMLAQAVQENHTEHLEVTTTAFRNFMGDHLGEWGLLFAERLAATSPHPLHQLTARLLVELWQMITTEHSLAPLAEGTPALLEEEATGPYECGMAERSVNLTIAGQAPDGNVPVRPEY
ncbi:MAG: hypothetical protein HJJLKODD_02701 [Phycisphaerae bacterium]|nr:hypothetical protein [Phycisphaerae bacterium]